MEGMFFGGWQSIGRIVLLATIVYVLLVLALRVTGARALAKMSAYDLVVTIALGSLIATIPLDKSVTLVDGMAAIGIFLVLQPAQYHPQTLEACPDAIEEPGRASAVGWRDAARQNAECSCE